MKKGTLISKPSTYFPKSNREIRAKQVRVIDQNSQMLGVMSIEEALKLALSVNLDLVEISSQTDPPVCKILNFGKLKYETKKRLQETKKKQKISVLKEIKLRPNIGQGDLEIKIKNMHKFLNAGDKVKISMIFRGREMIYHDHAKIIFSRIAEELQEHGKVELGPRMEMQQMLMILAPIK